MKLVLQELPKGALAVILETDDGTLRLGQFERVILQNAGPFYFAPAAVGTFGWDTKCLRMVMEKLAELNNEPTEDLRIELAAKDAEIYVPGQWHCPKCHFQYTTSIISSKGIAPNMEQAGPCPNNSCGGVALVRDTWKEDAIKMSERLFELREQYVRNFDCKTEPPKEPGRYLVLAFEWTGLYNTKPKSAEWSVRTWNGKTWSRAQYQWDTGGYEWFEPSVWKNLPK